MQNWNARDHEILAKTIFGESWKEDLPVQYAVGHVVMNRAKANTSYWGGSSIAEVCLKPGQFECWNSRLLGSLCGLLNISAKEDFLPFKGVEERIAYQNIYKWVPDLLNGKISDPTQGCYNYNIPSKECGDKEPQWVQQARAEGKRTYWLLDIGNHRFYHCLKKV